MNPSENNPERIHFIAVGGSAMHNLAIALKKKGCIITGSDDEIFEPSKSRLERYGLLPDYEGWDPTKITKDLNAVIIGMHARQDNPELIRAKELGLKVYSYPEFLYSHAQDKTRVVISGSHGKTTITSMILHVMNYYKKEFDYMVGAQLEGFEVMVKLSDTAKVIILEGDEYLTSPEDRRPKFHVYKADIGLISGIAWDHINVFPDFQSYLQQFEIFAGMIPANGTLIYCNEDKILKNLIQQFKPIANCISYGIPEYIIENGQTRIIYSKKEYPLNIFGKHNLLNLEAANKVTNLFGIQKDAFLTAMGSFMGASKRLELVKKDNNTSVYKDFAHSPSKVKASINALKELYPNRQLYACLELHTFSSLNKSFLSEYHNSMQEATSAIVYYNEHTIQLKRLETLNERDIQQAFGSKNILVFKDSAKLQSYLKSQNWKDKNLILMSSGNFDGLDFDMLANELIC